MKTLQGNADNKERSKMASATLSDATINLINNECKKATAPEISRKITRCRGHMTTIRNKMDGNVRTLKTHPANDAAATELNVVFPLETYSVLVSSCTHMHALCFPSYLTFNKLVLLK